MPIGIHDRLMEGFALTLILCFGVFGGDVDETVIDLGRPLIDLQAILFACHLVKAWTRSLNTCFIGGRNRRRALGTQFKGVPLYFNGVVLLKLIQTGCYEE